MYKFLDQRRIELEETEIGTYLFFLLMYLLRENFLKELDEHCSRIFSTIDIFFEKVLSSVGNKILRWYNNHK